MGRRAQAQAPSRGAVKRSMALPCALVDRGADQAGHPQSGQDVANATRHIYLTGISGFFSRKELGDAVAAGGGE